MAGAGRYLSTAGNSVYFVWLAGWCALFAGLRLPRVGAVLAISGVAVIVGSVYRLLSGSPEPLGAVLLLSAGSLFAAEAIWPMRLLAGAAGTAVLVWWFWLTAGSSSRTVALVAASAAGPSLAWLAGKAGEARRRKRVRASEEKAADNAGSPRPH